MTLMPWDRHYGAGIEQLDTDHRIIWDLIVQLDDAVDTGQGRDIVTNIFSVLQEFIRLHCRREEAALARLSGTTASDHLTSASAAAAHRREHDALLEGLLYVSQQWEAGERDVQDFVRAIRTTFEGTPIGVAKQRQDDAKQ